MAVVDTDLSKFATQLGTPSDYFVDEHDHVWRVVHQATGEVRFVVRPDGTLAPFAKPVSNPDAPPIVAEMKAVVNPAEFGAH